MKFCAFSKRWTVLISAAVLSGTCLSAGLYFSKKSSGRGGLETSGMNVIEQQLAEKSILSQIAENESEYEKTVSYHIYRVNSGDMIGFIAEKFGVSEDTLISVNKIKQSRLLQIGQYLKIPNMPGILYTVKNSGETLETVANYYKVDAEKCSHVNGIEKMTSLSEGQVVFIPDAKLDWVTRQEINGDLFVRPLKRYYLSSNYGWRESPFTGARSFHKGLDMAAAAGTPVRPALIGVVSATGFNSVYGNYIVISHHSGYKTLYAHLSSILCTKGQSVGLNTIIGKVGSTGQSTGPHLHFTVYKNGTTVNPMTLMK